MSPPAMPRTGRKPRRAISGFLVFAVFAIFAFFVHGGAAVQQPAAPPAPPILQEPQTILLWPGGAPGAQGAEDRDKPALTIYIRRTPPGR